MPERRTGQRARHDQHPRRALGDLQGRRSTRRRRQGRCPPARRRSASEFRKLPDALERAAELDAQYGRNPDLAALPMYCVPFSFKDPFDTKDMRSTGGADARYDIDFPARDHALVEQLRNKGAIIYAKAVLTEYNGRAGDPGGRNKPTKVLLSTLGYQRSTWGGNPSNAYDTTRAASLGSSSGLGGVGQHEPGDVQPVRRDARVVPRAGQPQLGGADPAAQGADRLRRRRDRLGHLQRPRPASTAATSPTRRRCSTR